MTSPKPQPTNQADKKSIRNTFRCDGIKISRPSGVCRLIERRPGGGILAMGQCEINKKAAIGRDAFVNPEQQSRTCDGRPPFAITRSFSSMNRKWSTCTSFYQICRILFLPSDLLQRRRQPQKEKGDGA